MSPELQKLNRAEIARLQKFEWVEAYVRARATALRPDNVLSGWRGAGLVPLRPSRIFRQLPDYCESVESTPPPHSEQHTLFNILKTPSNPTVLHSANIALNELVAAEDNLPTPVRQYIPKLTRHSEQVTADNLLLRNENDNLKSILSARKERQIGKHVTLKGHHLYSTLEILTKLRANEKATADKVKNKKPVKGRTPTPEPEGVVLDAGGECYELGTENGAIDPRLQVEME
jgi:hypothetical protein